MHIVHLIDYYQPQLGYQEAFLAHAHVALGHTVDVVTSERYAPHPQYQTTWQPVLGPRILVPGIYADAGARVHRLPITFERNGRLWLRGMESYLQQQRPELLLVHGMGSLTAVRALLARPRFNRDLRLVFDSHANEVNSLHPLRRGFYAAYRRLLTPLFLARADAIVAIDESSKAFLIGECGVPADRITIIPMGADTTLFHPEPGARVALRAELGIGEDDPVLIYAGKIQRRKGVHLLTAAALQLVPTFPGLNVILVGGGDPDYITEIQAGLSRSGEGQRFHWIGMVPNRQLYRYYSASDVSVWPLQVSIGTLEAQACGLPLIVADEPVLRERVNSQTGLLYKAGDMPDLVSKISTLVGNPVMRRQMGHNGRQLIERELSWNAIAQRFVVLAETQRP
jgi:glycosyltransferase involved in cell wall biosynthesis